MIPHASAPAFSMTRGLRSLVRHLPWVWLFGWFGAAAFLGARGSSEYRLPRALLPPSAGHPLGFDAFGRDVLALALKASLTSAGFALAAVAASCAIAVVAGSGLALAPPRAAFLGRRLLDGLLAFPSLLFALSWAAVRGPGWDTLLFALAIGVLPGFTRLIHVRAREVLSEGYVSAAYAAGATRLRVATRHLFPALLSLCALALPSLFAHSLLAEATLSFLGMGVPVGHDSWGSLLAQGKDYLIESPHLSVGAGVPLILTVLSLQLLSERSSSRRFGAR